MAGFMNREWSNSNPAAHVEILRIMINEGQYDPMEDANGTSVMHSFDGSPAVYRWLLGQEDFLIDFEQTAYNSRTIAGALLAGNHGLQASSCLEALTAHGSDLNDLVGRKFTDSHLRLAHSAVYDLRFVAEIDDFPKRIKLLWDAGANFGWTSYCLFFSCVKDRYGISELKRKSIPAPPMMSAEGVIGYDRLEDTSTIKNRPRTPKSLWRTWYPGNDLSVMEVVQRHLDAWMEVLLEAGIDIAEYGRREDQLHPEGLLDNRYGEARVYFEYGSHVDGCRIHVTEIKTYDPAWRDDDAEPSTMPGSWDFDGD